MKNPCKNCKTVIEPNGKTARYLCSKCYEKIATAHFNKLFPLPKKVSK